MAQTGLEYMLLTQTGFWHFMYSSTCRSHSSFLGIIRAIENENKPVQRQRKFSHVLGHTSENNSKTTLPAEKEGNWFKFLDYNFKDYYENVN